MSIEANKVTVRRYLQGDPDAGRDNIAVWDEICDPHVAMIGGPGFGEVHGLENLKEYATRYHSLASREILIEEMIAEGDKVAVRGTIRVTVKAPLTLPFGLPVPAGKSFTFTAISIVSLREGKVIEERSWADWLSVQQQLCVMPAAG